MLILAPKRAAWPFTIQGKNSEIRLFLWSKAIVGNDLGCRRDDNRCDLHN